MDEGSITKVHEPSESELLLGEKVESSVSSIPVAQPEYTKVESSVSSIPVAQPVYTKLTCCPQLHATLNTNPRLRCIKNMLLHSISCFLVFTPYMAFQSLDSTMNSTGGLGVITFSLLYTGLILSCILAPAIVRFVGCKEAMMMCFMMQLVFCLTHMFPRYYTLLPSSLLVGLSLGPFWTAQGVYTTTLSAEYSSLTGQDYNKILGRFYGLFNFFYLTSQKFGNLIESVVLGREDNATIPAPPPLFDYVSQNVTQCGAAFCSSDDGYVQPPPDTWDLYMLIIIYTSICLLGIIFKAGFVEGIKKNITAATRGVRSGIYPAQNAFDANLSESLRIHKKNKMYLLLPLFFYNGLQQGFIYGDYTESFIACQLGMEHIGFVMLVYGYADAFTSLLVGWLERYTGRRILFLLAATVQVALVVFMLLWRPDDDGTWILYVVPAFWGMGDAVWQTTTSSMIGVIFYNDRDSAFACFRLWQAAGLATAFSYSHVLCTWVKLYVIVAVIVFSMTSYCVMELYNKTQSQPNRQGYERI